MRPGAAVAGLIRLNAGRPGACKDGRADARPGDGTTTVIFH